MCDVAWPSLVHATKEIQLLPIAYGLPDGSSIASTNTFPAGATVITCHADHTVHPRAHLHNLEKAICFLVISRGDSPGCLSKLFLSAALRRHHDFCMTKIVVPKTPQNSGQPEWWNWKHQQITAGLTDPKFMSFKSSKLQTYTYNHACFIIKSKSTASTCYHFYNFWAIYIHHFQTCISRASTWDLLSSRGCKCFSGFGIKFVGNAIPYAVP